MCNLRHRTAPGHRCQQTYRGTPGCSAVRGTDCRSEAPTLAVYLIHLIPWEPEGQEILYIIGIRLIYGLEELLNGRDVVVVRH